MTPAHAAADFLPRLEVLMERATPLPWCAESCGEKGDGSNLIGVAFHPDNSGGNANFIMFLANHAPAIAQLVRAAEYYATEYRIADEAGELGFWPANEMLRCKAIAYALAALNAEDVK